MSGNRDACVRVQVQCTREELLPQKAHLTDAGYDLRADLASPITLQSGGQWVVPTGVSIGLPICYEAQIRPRSGLAAKHGITVVNSPGTIDAGYRGEIKVILLNTGPEPFVINDLDRIAQMVICKLPTVGLDIISSLDNTDRGTNGFGSSGTN